MGTIIVFGLLAFASAATAATVPCTDHSACGAGMFCYMRRFCSLCLDCSAYHREGSGACAKEPSNCGDCLPGYEPEILTDGRMRELCVPHLSSTKTVTMQTPQPQVMEAVGDWMRIGLVVGSISLVTSIIIGWVVLSRRAIKIKHRTRFMPCNDSNSTSSATLYAPTAPPHFHALTSNPKEESERFLGGIVYEKASDSRQQAAICHNPSWVRSPNNDPSHQDPPADVVDGPNPPNDYLIEENTLPSDWTPGPQYGEPSSLASGPLITSFEGILQLNNMANGAGGQPDPQPTNHTANNQEASHINVTNITVINAGPSNTGICNITKT